MNEETQEQSAPQRVTPICPYCLADPFEPNGLPFNVNNGVQLLVISCDKCRKVMSVVILKLPEPRVVQQPRILRPQ